MFHANRGKNVSLEYNNLVARRTGRGHNVVFSAKKLRPGSPFRVKAESSSTLPTTMGVSTLDPKYQSKLPFHTRKLDNSFIVEKSKLYEDGEYIGEWEENLKDSDGKVTSVMWDGENVFLDDRDRPVFEHITGPLWAVMDMGRQVSKISSVNQEHDPKEADSEDFEEYEPPNEYLEDAMDTRYASRYPSSNAMENQESQRNWFEKCTVIQSGSLYYYNRQLGASEWSVPPADRFRSAEASAPQKSLPKECVFSDSEESEDSWPDVNIPESYYQPVNPQIIPEQDPLSCAMGGINMGDAMDTRKASSREASNAMENQESPRNWFEKCTDRRSGRPYYERRSGTSERSVPPADRPRSAVASAPQKSLPQKRGIRPQVFKEKMFPKRSSTISCPYGIVCDRFINSLKLPDVYFEPRFDQCFCESCIDSRGDDMYYMRGIPPKLYSLPRGWCHFGLHVPAKAHGMEAFSKWHVAYHGTVPQNIRTIIESDNLLMPGDYTIEGNQLAPPPGHYTESRKPVGFDVKQVFVSPTIAYAGAEAYAKPQRWTDPETRQDLTIQVALKVRIKPGSYKVGKETLGLRDQILDDRIPNSELEWSTRSRGATILQGILVKFF